VRSLVGPYFVLNQSTPHAWCYFELTEHKATHFIWHNSRWSVQEHHDNEAVLYAYSPSEKAWLSFVLTQDQELFKIPVFEQRLENNELPARRVSQVFRPFLSETDVRWLPHHLTRASAFKIDPTVFPAVIDNI